MNSAQSFCIARGKKKFGRVQLQANVVCRLEVAIEDTNRLQHLLVHVLVVEGYPRSDIVRCKDIVKRICEQQSDF